VDDSDARMKILLSGLHDWVSLDEARHLVRSVCPPDTSSIDVRSMTLTVVSDLLTGNLAIAGDLTSAFEPWSGTSDEIVQRIASTWTNLDHAEWLGIGWLANTPAGDALARPVWDALPDPTDDRV
jgi:hypothetical protein